MGNHCVNTTCDNCGGEYCERGCDDCYCRDIRKRDALTFSRLVKNYVGWRHEGGYSYVREPAEGVAVLSERFNLHRNVVWGWMEGRKLPRLDLWPFVFRVLLHHELPDDVGYTPWQE